MITTKSRAQCKAPAKPKRTTIPVRRFNKSDVVGRAEFSEWIVIGNNERDHLERKAQALERDLVIQAEKMRKANDFTFHSLIVASVVLFAANAYMLYDHIGDCEKVKNANSVEYFMMGTNAP